MFDVGCSMFDVSPLTTPSTLNSQPSTFPSHPPSGLVIGHAQVLVHHLGKIEQMPRRGYHSGELVIPRLGNSFGHPEIRRRGNKLDPGTESSKHADGPGHVHRR